MLMWPTLSRLAKEQGHRVRVMGVLSELVHIFNETAMHARAQASNRLARRNRASRGPRVRAKERVNETRKKPKESPKEPKVRSKVPKACTRVKHRKLVYQVWKARNQRQALKLRHLHKHVPLTIHGCMMDGVLTSGMMAGVLMNGTMTGVLLDGNKRMTILQAHFHLEVWILVPRVVRNGLNG